MIALIIIVLWSILGFVILIAFEPETEKTLGLDVTDFPIILLAILLWPIVMALDDNIKTTKKEQEPDEDISPPVK